MSPARRRRQRTVSALAVGSVALLAACGSSTNSATSSSATSAAAAAAGGASAANLPKTLVFSPLSLAPPALKGLSEGVKGYAGSKGWQVLVQDPNFDATKQTQQLDEVLNSGRAGAAWVIAVAPKSMAGTLKAAQSKKVPILVNGRPDEYGYSDAQPGITFDYIDYTAAGKALGEQLGNCLNAKNGGAGKVLFGVSTPGQAGKQEFEAAATSALKATAPKATIVQSIPIGDRAKGQTDIGNVLQGNPDLAGVMSTTDEAALGAIGAFAAAGKTLKCNVDFGGNDEVLNDVKSGKMFATVALQFQADMAQSFDTLAKMQADPTAKGLVLTVPQKVITANG
jgi:ABC-type sugar transport system substrate-binding protein